MHDVAVITKVFSGRAIADHAEDVVMPAVVLSEVGGDPVDYFDCLQPYVGKRRYGCASGSSRSADAFEDRLVVCAAVAKVFVDGYPFVYVIAGRLSDSIAEPVAQGWPPQLRFVVNCSPERRRPAFAEQTYPRAEHQVRDHPAWARSCRQTI